MKRDVLCRPFAPEQIKQREGQGGKMLNYIEAHAVVARLNEACGEDGWSFEIVEHKILDEEVIVVAKLTAGTVTKMAFGGSSVTRSRDGLPMSIADDLKAAGSDALKKAASLLGVGLHLYGGTGAPAAQARPASPAPSSPNDRLTSRQLSAIQSIARRHNIGRDRMNHMLDERFGKIEVGHLSRREASSLLSELTGSNGAG
ncbi:MAG: hypothetical protein KF764_00870 [Labilithrix sp.]|nr:hypothetical protein [Labilithrix sp.]